MPIHPMQILMSVPPTMEGVNSTVITPLVASTAAVLQDTICWMRMDSTAMVRDSHYAPGRKIMSPYI